MKPLYFDDWLKKQLKDPEFKRDYDRLEPQYQVLREIIKTRLERKMSQRHLATKAKTTQAVLSRLENFEVNPSIGLVQRIAEAMGKKLEIKFV